MQLIRPGEEHLGGYLDALDRGWSPDPDRSGYAHAERARIESDVTSYLAGMDDREALGPPVTLPDGSSAPRIPGIRRWLWDGQFCGTISFRWQPGTTALPPDCLGHIGYSVVPWKRRRGYATQSLRQMLPLAQAEGLGFVEVVTDLDNIASQRVIEANGAVLVGQLTMPAAYGRGPGLLYRITLS
jgi:predicted acetyltransferase